MNVFACSPDADASARALADRHVVKMTLETAQVLSTVLHVRGLDVPGLYRPTHRRHPCTLWADTEPGADAWLLAHGLALADEYRRRFGREHASAAVVALAAPHVGSGTPARFVFVGDADLASGDVHAAYRAQLARKYAAWGAAARWTRASRPGWG